MNRAFCCITRRIMCHKICIIIQIFTTTQFLAYFKHSISASKAFSDSGHISIGHCLRQKLKSLFYQQYNMQLVLIGQPKPLSFKVRDNHQVFLNFQISPSLEIFKSQKFLTLNVVHINSLNQRFLYKSRQLGTMAYFLSL